MWGIISSIKVAKYQRVGRITQPTHFNGTVINIGDFVIQILIKINCDIMTHVVNI